MIKRKKTIYEYITEDGEVFESEEEAKEYELKLLYEQLWMTKKTICGYEIIIVRNQKELEALFVYADEYDEILKPEDIKSYPCMICCKYIGDYMCAYYTIDDVINTQSKSIEELSRYRDTI